MIKSVIVTNYLGESVQLRLGELEPKSGLLITNIDGLGPAKANVNTTEMATNDGDVYNSSRLTKRNIVLTLRFGWVPTIEQARQNSYKYFPIKRRVGLLFETDNRICEVFGYVESNEPNIFSPESETKISIICPDPYFYSVEENVLSFYSMESLFEFPFENDSVSEPMIEMGSIQLKSEQTIYYTGDAETGIVINIHAIGSVSNVTIFNMGTREVMKLDTNRLQEMTGYGIIAGDDITISTVRGKKSVYLLRNGVRTNIINCLDKQADWFQLAKGDNVFAYTADAGSVNLQFKITNQIVYEGV